MNPQIARQMLDYLNKTLSTKNLYPQQCQQLLKGKEYLESYLASHQRDEAMRRGRGLLQELMQGQNSNLFLGEGLSRAPGTPGAGYGRERTAPDLIYPKDYMQSFDAIMRTIQPNPAHGDRMVIDPDRFDSSKKRSGGI